MGNLKCKLLFPLGTNGTEPKPLPTDKYEWDGVTNIIELLPSTDMHPALYGHMITSDVYTDEHLYDSTFKISDSDNTEIINERTDISILDNRLPNGTYTYGNSYSHNFAVIVVPSSYTVDGRTILKGTYMTKINDLYTSEINVALILVIKSITIDENGIHYAPDAVAYDEIRTNVPTVEPILEELSVDTNGTYEPGQGVDGFNKVNVDVKPTYSVQDETLFIDGIVESEVLYL